ncbi:ATP-binding protein [Nocardia aurantiaca]|uniref:ATP-binding protein n=1 Tax=Nocardia aurantiaca TaxID=2675850 RepID=A0A6I3L751_9NOCA|nr:ATP-binding protein [Nocardia aurantiaca]MTE16266.1 ATP-binding protein [Nocardia aurantiaca]
MKITPSARVLRMLGEIEFDEWQCIAELVDNSFDDFTEIHRAGTPWAGGYHVSVRLPASGDGQLVVEDTGQGMDRERLERAVRAGWSGNDMHDKLGLFGMGFNVASARLGRRTRVLTTRQGDPEWIGVDIDLDRINDDFEAEDIVEPKADPNEHGTRIIVSRLKPDRAEWLRKNGANLRNHLGGVYSWILENRPFDLTIGGVRVKPVRHCRWGDDRSVLYNRKERIPAYIEIDTRLEDGLACADCGEWQLQGRQTCGDCGSTRLAVRERRVHGWLGVQRYLDKKEFGIDFLRNGRKILRWDKRIFSWRNPNGELGNEEPEYPVELAHQGGRIIGEIHLDHVPVAYQKNAFEYDDRSWKAAMEILRGVGPLLPQRAKDAGYSENDSPLARLVKGYRRNDAGERCLIPGDPNGKGPIHAETRAWGREFQNGKAEYQSDELWWQAVLDYEAAKRGEKSGNAAASTPESADTAAVLEALGLGNSMNDTPARGNQNHHQAPPSTGPASVSVASTTTVDVAPKRETRQERIARYTADSTVYPTLSKSLGDPEIGYVQVDARRLTAGALVDDKGNPTPVLLDQRRGMSFTAFLDLEHEVFKRFGVDPADLLIAELAVLLKVKTDSDWSHSQIIAAIRAKSLPDTALDPQVIGAEAQELLGDIRQRMARALDSTGDPARAFQHLTPDELTSTEIAMIADGKVARTSDLGTRADFLLHVPALFLVRLVEAWPDAFMDGLVFKGLYAGVTSLGARRLSVARVVGYLADVATVVSSSAANLPSQLERTRLSIRLLSDELPEEQ